MKLFVTGTDTDVGKTIFSAALVGALGSAYWKPIQAGTLDSSDTDTVRKLSGVPTSKIFQEAYRFTNSCSPHRAAELDSTRIELGKLLLPDADPLVVEGAGGLLVPLDRKTLFVEFIARWRIPVVLVARTTLGTINHSLLSIEGLKARSIPVLGIAFVGDPNPDSERTICELARIKRLGRLPVIDPLDRDNLGRAFTANFDVLDFQ